MGYGGWRGIHDFQYPADSVFKHLLGVLERDGYEIRSSDPDKRGVVAYGRANWSFLRRGVSRPRIAARVDETSAGTARLTIESAPAFVPQMFGEPAHRHRAEIITLHLQQSLDP